MAVQLQRAYRQPNQRNPWPDSAYWTTRRILVTFEQPALTEDMLDAMGRALAAHQEIYPARDVVMDALIGGNFVISRKLDREGK